MVSVPSQCRHNQHHGVSNHKQLHCWFNCIFVWTSKKTSKLRVTNNSTVGSTACSDEHQRKHQSSASQSVCEGIPALVVYPHKGPVTRKMFSCRDAMSGIWFPSNNWYKKNICYRQKLLAHVINSCCVGQDCRLSFTTIHFITHWCHKFSVGLPNPPLRIGFLSHCFIVSCEYITYSCSNISVGLVNLY